MNEQSPPPRYSLLGYIVVGVVALLALIGLSAIAATIFIKHDADPTAMAALIATTNSLAGSLITIVLVKLQQQTGIKPDQQQQQPKQQP
jgi:hypothetical protein